MDQLIKKPKYIRKYDYLRSFYQPKNHWFIDPEMISQFIANKTKHYLKSSLTIDLDDAEFDEHDSYSVYKENKDNKNIEIDHKIYEGNLIDTLSKQYIQDQFKLYKNNAIDFSLQQYHHLDNDQLFKLTLEKLNNHDDLILFQPTFIHNGLIDKPDALVRVNNQYTLIEVKGTTNPKINHLFDLFFQKNVIGNALDEHFDAYISDFKLCLVKYELLNLKAISFVLVDGVSLSKTGFKITKKQQESLPSNCFSDSFVNFNAALRENKIDENKTELLSLNYLLNHFNADDFKDSRAKETIKFIDENLNLDAFNLRINELKNHVTEKQISLIPDLNFKSKIKDCDYWNYLKEYYYLSHKYLPMNFSGKLIQFKDAVKINQSLSTNDLDQLINWFYNNQIKIGDFQNSKQLDEYCRMIKSHQLTNISNKIFFDCNKIKNVLNQLKDKHVYFDFESINLATRVIDHTVPFMQAVNQVSVANLINNQLVPKKGLVIDPVNGINKEHLKQIVDMILPSEDLNECKQYSYIVYNQNFEKTCLTKMNYYLNDPLYERKINVIINNMFDLADLFTIKREQRDFILFKDLCGYYSIKKVLPLVAQYDPSSYAKANCVDYKSIAIHNGVDAQKYSSMRFFHLIDDIKWREISENLRIYCNNDVNAMVAIYFFVSKLVNN